MTPPSRPTGSDDQLVRIALRHHRAPPDDPADAATPVTAPSRGRSLRDANTPLGAAHYDPLLARMMTRPVWSRPHGPALGFANWKGVVHGTHHVRDDIVCRQAEGISTPSKARGNPEDPCSWRHGRRHGRGHCG